jgi:hypothetical protein
LPVSIMPTQDEDVNAPRWMRRFILLTLSLLLIVAAGGSLYYYFVSNEETLEYAAAEADCLDPGWRWEELQANRRTIPKAENAAAYVRKAKSLLPMPWPAPRQHNGTKAFRLDDIPAPQFQLRLDQAASLKKELERVAPALAVARRLTDLNWGRYQVSLPEPAVPMAAPVLMGVVDAYSREARVVALLLRLEAVLQCHEGDLDRALETGRAVLNAGRSVGDEPGMAPQLTRMECEDVAVAVIERTLAQGQPAVRRLETMEGALEEESKDPLALYAMRGDRARLYEWNQALRALIKDSSPKSTAQFIKRALRGILNPEREDGIDRFERRDLRSISAVVEIAKLPVEQQLTRLKELPDFDSRLHEADWTWTNNQRSWESMYEAFMKSQARLRTAALALSVERFRRLKSRWPTSPAEIVEAGLIRRIPSSPYDGAPLSLRRLKDGVIVNWMGPRPDLGFKLWDVEHRRQPAQIPTYPGRDD